MSKVRWATMALIILYTVDSLLTDTAVRWTPSVGPCLSLLPLFEFLYDADHYYKLTYIKGVKKGKDQL